MPANIYILFTSLLAVTLGELDFAIHVKGGTEAANRLAEKHHMVNMGEIIPETGYFLLRTKENTRRKRSLRDLKEVFKTDTVVDWSEFQAAKVRVKRDPIRLTENPRRESRHIEHRQSIKPWSVWTDPQFDDMWYLNRRDDHNMKVEGAWNLGMSGQGVAVTIVDDGIEKDHPDLVDNYDPLSSTDINDLDSDPQPRYDPNDSNRHGTRCAGQVAAGRNNSHCMVGIAYNAQIGGIRMLDGPVTDAVEARSLSFNSDHIDIYSSSWGPNDDGKTVDGPGILTSSAIQKGANHGRDGKGSIFVWASGNGGRYKDNCNCDGYAASIYTITVSSTTERGEIPWYSEPCSATIATTYSSGSSSDRQIATTDLHHKCTTKHTGTSASAPMAAAIIALTLEANPDLTWRDVQHIMVRTAKQLNLEAPDWQLNGAGRPVSHSYGFGLMDAEAMVEMAQRWISVPAQQSCEVVSPYYYKPIPASGQVTIELDVNSCHVNYLEHVISPIHVKTAGYRGNLRIYLQSPSGTRAQLLDNRPHDISREGFNNWPFMSVHSWGENPSGRWRLEIYNDAKTGPDAKLYQWSLKFYGTSYDPNSDYSYNPNSDYSYDPNSDYSYDPNSDDNDEGLLDDEYNKVKR